VSYPRQVVELARPFPPKYISDDGRGNAYVAHHIVTQRLIAIFGGPPKIEVLREIYDEGRLTGVIMRLTTPGGFSVEEAGEADNPQSKTNGARAKDACSDAIKRCAMRLGLGLHLWSQGDYFLHQEMASSNGETSGAAGEGADPASPETSEEESRVDNARGMGKAESGSKGTTSDAVGAGGETVEKAPPAPSGYPNRPDDGHNHAFKRDASGELRCKLCGEGRLA
jgi:hypothetical protein